LAVQSLGSYKARRPWSGHR